MANTLVRSPVYSLYFTIFHCYCDAKVNFCAGSRHTNRQTRTPAGHAPSLPQCSGADEIISEWWVAADSQQETLIRAVPTLRCFDIGCIFQQLQDVGRDRNLIPCKHLTVGILQLRICTLIGTCSVPHTDAVLQNGLQRELREWRLEALMASDIRWLEFGRALLSSFMNESS